MGARRALALLATATWAATCRPVAAAVGVLAGLLAAGGTETIGEPPSVSGLLMSAATSDSIVRAFQESYRVQTEDDDLVSAWAGFDALARTRRGDPWPGPVRNDPRCVTVSESSVSRAPGDDGGVWDDAACVRAFLAAKNATVCAFTTREQEHAATSPTYNVASAAGWAVDPISLFGRGTFFVATLHKLDHDREQLEYLLAKKRLPGAFQELVDGYAEVRSSIVETMVKRGNDIQPQEVDRSEFVALGSKHFERLRGTYNALLHVPHGSVAGSVAGASPFHPTRFKTALNPNLDWDAIERAYLSQEVPLLWFDGFLQPEALEGILEFCREATVFSDVKLGYLGAYVTDGLTSPWLLQLVRDLQKRLPRVLEGMTLSNMWAYKFDSDTSMDGIAVHADSATVNLNFWLTPDEANLDPTSGGLVVYPKVPPNRGLQQGAAAGSDHVDTDTWNNWSKAPHVKQWLKDEGVLDDAATIPYRQNRVVIFDSRLLHETDAFRFRQGYENRRINVTLLFSPKATPKKQ